MTTVSADEHKTVSADEHEYRRLEGQEELNDLLFWVFASERDARIWMHSPLPRLQMTPHFLATAGLTWIAIGLLRHHAEAQRLSHRLSEH